jgi:Polyketide cyclase / dehydrase and lipid transport
MATRPNYATTVKRSHHDIAVTLEARIAANQSLVFDYVAKEGVLPAVLTGYTPFLPAVVSTSGNTGRWDIPGSSRTVHLKDGSTALEEVTAYNRPALLAYKSSQFTFALRYLAIGATGQWWFEADDAATKVRWTCTFKAKGRLSARVLAIFARLLWTGYMRVCLNNIQRHFMGHRRHANRNRPNADLVALPKA